MAEYLNDREHELVELFKDEISQIFPNSGILNYNTALKFLLARKFDIQRAKTLYIAHEQARVRERLSDINPFHERVRAELLSGKFTILPARDSEGAAQALFTVRLHDPGTSSRLDLLRSLLFQLDAALDSIETQRYGLVFIYDMTDCKFHNFDFELSKKILSLLKDSYPARLRKVLIVNPPVWFKYPFKCLQILLKKKLQERVCMVNTGQLVQHLPIFSIPVRLGGNLRYDHRSWLEQCLQRNSVGSNSSFDRVRAFLNEQPDVGKDQFRKCSTNSVDSSCSNHSFKPQEQSPGLVLLAAARSRQSIHLRSYRGQTAREFVELVEKTSQSELANEFGHLDAGPQNRTHFSKLKENCQKNRYADVPCLDGTRVHLLGVKGQDTSVDDYIHANFVDGYELSYAYICTQGPLPHTAIDFWKMIWDYHVPIIVMLTRTKESGRVKCHQYWPKDLESIENHGNLAVINNGVVANDDSFIESSLLLQDTMSMEMREVTHMQFVAWPDYGTPDSSEKFLNFLLLVKKKLKDLSYHPRVDSTAVSTPPPIVIHCSAGIGRSGTFVAMDVSIDRLVCGDGRVNIFGLVNRIRSQRLGSIQTSGQYVFCHAAMAHFITSRGLLDSGSS